ncbi:hypothetical protein BJ085DRAFT_40386 [Dimargaris cristalligena]|uniref:Uncharacterized protein n=1 Tax=Dimargaris cristalligena TaxID=215637 RepID=A0A4P9ZRA4_9FUNG|nr:hypothetical protein BJ085DRAFT_40386 [Dimargaris cristalligena]|eukprot:RKP35688.1 hypothetical protein BJ085DRAFT_40386 [Dimargaris cristalligena]
MLYYYIRPTFLLGLLLLLCTHLTSSSSPQAGLNARQLSKREYHKRIHMPFPMPTKTQHIHLPANHHLNYAAARLGGVAKPPSTYPPAQKQAFLPKLLSKLKTPTKTKNPSGALPSGKWKEKWARLKTRASLLWRQMIRLNATPGS